MSKPQMPISVQFSQEWRIRRPVIYRYLEKKFVDDFFQSGLLRISSFSKFSQHCDEERKDMSEGFGVVTHQNSEGEGQTIIASLSQGSNAYVLCGSMSLREDLSNAFGTDSGFRINDSLGFSAAVARYIPGFHIGQEGPCFYVGQKSVNRDMGPIDWDTLKPSQESEEFDPSKISRTMLDAAGDDLFFMKHDIYAHQNEYRLLWHTPQNVFSHIDIVCPEARQFCSRFEDLWKERSDK